MTYSMEFILFAVLEKELNGPKSEHVSVLFVFKVIMFKIFCVCTFKVK